MKIPSLKIKVRKLGKSGWLRALLLVLAVGATCVLGAMFGAYMTIRNNLPSVDEIENLRPKIITTILSDKGETVKEFAEERRIEVPYASIPEVLKKAIIATEDPRFYAHNGVDYVGILRAVKEDVIKIGRGSLRRPQGGSTITQQLARSLFLYSKQTIRRKLKEMAVALSIEKKYSKERILELYCNQFYLGHGAYGVESASNLYFGKSVSDLSLDEAALIAGIFRGPSVYSPYTNAEKTLQRRNHVLNRMADEKYITRDQAEAAKARPIRVLPLRRAVAEVGAYFFEEVRRYLEKNYGADALYNAGLKVYTTLDPELQKYAEDSLRAGLRVQDKKRGWRRDKKNLLAEGTADLRTVWLESWTTPRGRARRGGGRRCPERFEVRGFRPPEGPRRPHDEQRHRVDAGPEPGRPDPARGRHSGPGEDGPSRGRGYCRRLGPGTPGRRGVPGHRPPDGADQGDERRLFLPPKPVQPGDTGPPPDGVGHQALPLHGCRRERFHPGDHHPGRAGDVQRQMDRGPLDAPELRPDLQGFGDPPQGSRGIAERGHGPDPRLHLASGRRRLLPPVRPDVVHLPLPLARARDLRGHAPRACLGLLGFPQ